MGRKSPAPESMPGMMFVWPAWHLYWSASMFGNLNKNELYGGVRFGIGEAEVLPR